MTLPDPPPSPLATVRFFCLVLPPGHEQTGYEYLDALDRSGKRVVACPIGMAYFTSAPWSGITRLFSGLTAPRFVNVVCAPPGLVMGARMRAADVKPPLDPSGVAWRKELSQEVVYEPSTALSGLYTVGVPNVAITTLGTKPLESSEIRALAQYDAVFTPSGNDAEALRALGIHSMHIPPDPALLGRLMGWLL